MHLTWVRTNMYCVDPSHLSDLDMRRCEREGFASRRGAPRDQWSSKIGEHHFMWDLSFVLFMSIVPLAWGI